MPRLAILILVPALECLLIEVRRGSSMFIDPAIKYVQFVVPAKAGIQ